MSNNKTSDCNANQNTNLSLDNCLCPADTCVFCDKTLEQTGGMRLASQNFRGVSLSEKYRGGGNKDRPYQSFKLSNDPEIYLMVWGEKSKWTELAIKKAKNEYLNGKRPWFCQVCGARTCSRCGTPINYPMGSEILYDNGCSSHASIIPCDPGCSNLDCDGYKKWGRGH